MTTTQPKPPIEIGPTATQPPCDDAERRTHAQWVTVRCPECGKKLCEATPGSTVKKLCDRCKAERVVSIAA